MTERTARGPIVKPGFWNRVGTGIRDYVYKPGDGFWRNFGRGVRAGATVYTGGLIGLGHGAATSSIGTEIRAAGTEVLGRLFNRGTTNGSDAQANRASAPRPNIARQSRPPVQGNPYQAGRSTMAPNWRPGDAGAPVPQMAPNGQNYGWDMGSSTYTLPNLTVSGDPNSPDFVGPPEHLAGQAPPPRRGGSAGGATRPAFGAAFTAMRESGGAQSLMDHQAAMMRPRGIAQ